MNDLQSLLSLGKFDEAKVIIQEFDRRSANYKLNNYFVLLFQGEYSDLDQLLQDDNIGNYHAREDEIAFLYFKGEIGLKMRRLEEGIAFVKQGLDLYQSSEGSQVNRLWYSRLITSEGNYLGYVGEFSQSLQLFMKAKEIFLELGDILGVLQCFSNLCASSYFLGDLNDSLNYGLQALKMYDIYETRIAYEIITNNIGLVYHSQNQSELALKYFYISEKIHQGNQNQVLLAVTYINIIQAALSSENFSMAKIYFDKYSSLDQQHPLVSLLSKIAEAITLAMSPRIKEKAMALSILEEVAKGPTIAYQFLIFARYAHVDLLLEEYFAFGSYDIILEIKIIVDELVTMAEQKGLQLVKINASLLKSRLLLIDGKYENATALLTSTLKDAKERGMTTISEIVKIQLARLNNQIPYWEDLNEQNTPLADMIHNSGFKRLLKQVLNNRLYDILQDESTPLFLIILQFSGIPVYSNRFKDSLKSGYNAILIANLLVALDMFGKEVLAKDVQIDQIHFSDNVILLKKSNHLGYAFAYNGPSGRPLVQLSEFIEAVEKIEAIKNINQKLIDGLPIIQDLTDPTRNTIDELVSGIFLT